MFLGLHVDSFFWCNIQHEKTTEQAQQAAWKKTMLATAAANQDKAAESQRRLSAALSESEAGRQEREEQHRVVRVLFAIHPC